MYFHFPPPPTYRARAELFRLSFMQRMKVVAALAILASLFPGVDPRIWYALLIQSAPAKIRRAVLEETSEFAPLLPQTDSEKAIARMGNRHRDRSHWELEVAPLSNKEFRAMYKVTRQRFRYLADLIAPRIVPDDMGKVMAMVSSGSYISAETALACALRYLAGAVTRDVWTLHGVSKSSCYEKVKITKAKTNA